MSLHQQGRLPKHVLLTTARSEAFSENARVILRRLGYGIFTREELDLLEVRRDSESGMEAQIDMVVLDEHCLDAFLEAASGQTPPVLLLTGRKGIRHPHPQVVAAIKRPAGLHDLYRILQQYFEDVPRNTPRVSTHIRAECSCRGKVWSAAVVSLSENGCLLRSPLEVPLGSHFDLSLRLPRVGTIEIEAESAYQLVPDMGLVFNSVEPWVREAIQAYVINALRPD